MTQRGQFLDISQHSGRGSVLQNSKKKVKGTSKFRKLSQKRGTFMTNTTLTGVHVDSMEMKDYLGADIQG